MTNLISINHQNGRGRTPKEYVCRMCKKRVPQTKIRVLLNKALNRIMLSEQSIDELFKALKPCGTKMNFCELIM